MSKHHDTRTNKSGCLYNNTELPNDENTKLNKQKIKPATGPELNEGHKRQSMSRNGLPAIKKNRAWDDINRTILHKSRTIVLLHSSIPHA